MILNHATTNMLIAVKRKFWPVYESDKSFHDQ